MCGSHIQGLQDLSKTSKMEVVCTDFNKKNIFETLKSVVCAGMLVTLNAAKTAPREPGLC